MDWSPRETLEALIAQAQQVLVNVQIIDYDVDERRALITLEGQWGSYRKAHQHEEIPHQHDANRTITLTSGPMTFAAFVEWLVDNLKSSS